MASYGEATDEAELAFDPNQPISAGAKRDIKTLLLRTVILFDEYNNLRYQHFLDIYREMKFSLIFCGRQRYRETYELIEDLLDLVKLEASPKNKTPFRAAGIYLLYALYNKQPIRPTVKIKVTLDEFKAFSKFISECRDNQHWEVVYVWMKLLADDAFYYVAVGRPVGIDTIIGNARRRAAGLPCGDDYKLQETENPLKSEKFKSLVKKLDQIHSQYTGMKVALREIPEVPDKGLSMISETLPQEMRCQFEQPIVKEKPSDRKGNVCEDEKGETIGERRRKLKLQGFDDGNLSYLEVKRKHAAEKLMTEISPANEVESSQSPEPPKKNKRGRPKKTSR